MLRVKKCTKTFGGNVMKKQTTKIVSMLLAIIMLMSLVTIPAFASTPTFRDPYAKMRPPGATSNVHRSWIPPYGDEVSHFDYNAEDGDNKVEYYFYTAERESMSIDEKGILTMNSKRADTSLTHASRVRVSSDNRQTYEDSGNINIYADSPYIFNFEDPYCLSGGVLYAGATDKTTDLFENVAVQSDASGNKYLVSAV